MPAPTRGARRPRSGSNIVTSPLARTALAALRIVVGSILLWTFLDKMFGFGLSTLRQMAWINGGQPAQGFTKGVAVHSPFGSAFELLANPASDWLFMVGMLGVGVALTLGIGPKMSVLAASALVVPLYLAPRPIGTGGIENAATNPLVDLHWVLTLSAILFALTRAGDTLGLGAWWSHLVGGSRLHQRLRCRDR